MKVQPADTVYAVYYSDRHKLELYRKYTVLTMGRKYITVRDFFDPSGVPRRFHVDTLRSAAELPAVEELIDLGPRLEQARAAVALLTAFANIERDLRAARATMYDHNKLRMLRDTVVTAEIAAEVYLEAIRQQT